MVCHPKQDLTNLTNLEICNIYLSMAICRPTVSALYCLNVMDLIFFYNM